MPLYTFLCAKCESTMEQMRKIDDRDRLTLCKRCRRPLERQIDAPGAVWSPSRNGGHT